MPESLHGLRLSRFYNYEGVQYLPAPTGGWNPDANPWELPENQAMVLDNFIIRPGKIVMRAPISQTKDLSTLIAGAHQFSPVGGIFVDAPNALGITSGALLLSRQDPTTLNFIDPWNSVLRNADAAHCGVADTKLYQLNLDTGGAVASAALTADQIPGPRSVNFDGLIYAISYDSAAAAVHDTNTTYFIRPLSLMTIPSVQSPPTIPAPTVLANAPHGAFDLKGYLSRIWLLGGVDTPGALTVHEPTTLYYTNPGTSGVGTASADWKDPVSGLTNKIRMDNDISDYGVGLATVPNALLIFRRGSVWSLRGSTSSTFQLQPVTLDIGCLDARSIVETSTGVYFISHRGLMFTDGTSVSNVSGSVEEALVAVLRYEQLNLRFGGGYITTALDSEGRIMLSIGAVNTGVGGIFKSLNPELTAVFDPRLGVWTRFSSGLWQAENVSSTVNPSSYAPLFISRHSRQQLYTIGDFSVTQLENGPTGVTHLMALNTSCFDKDQTPTRYPIPAAWSSRVIPISTVTRKEAQAKRYFLDHVFAHTGQGGPAATLGWTIQPMNADDTALDSAVTTGITTTQSAVTPHGALKALPRIARKNADFLMELHDMYFSVVFTDTTIVDIHAGAQEIYGIGLEMQHTRDSR